MGNNKPNVKFFQSIRFQLAFSFGVVSVLSLFIVSWLLFSQSKESLQQQVEKQLLDVRNLKAGQLDTFFETVSEDIRLLAKSSEIIQATQKLAVDSDELYEARLAYHANPILTDAGNNTTYDNAHKQYHPFFKNIVETKEYDDIYLINKNGDVIYNFDKGGDFATNLKTGVYHDTHLAKLFEDLSSTTYSTKEFVKFTDFVRYRPSRFRPAGFVGTPIFTSIEGNEENIGVLVFQLPLDRINELMHRETEKVIGKSGEIYLVGHDNKMRSESRFSQENESTILEQEVNNQAVQNALRGGTDLEAVISYRGLSVLNAYQPIQFGDQTWALIAEVNEDEALAQTNQLLKLVFYIVFISILTTIGAGFAITRWITQPITNLTKTATAIAEGDLSRSAEVESANEIGLLAETFNNLTEKLQERIDKLQAVNEIGRELTRKIHLPQQEILELIYQQTSRLMDTTNMFIAWYDADKRMLSFPLAYYEGKWDDIVADIERSVDDPSKKGLTEVVIRDKKTLRLDDVAQYLQENNMTLPEDPVPKSWLGVPIFIEGKLIGVVVLYNYEATELYSQNDQDVLEAMVDQAAVAIKNVELYSQLEEANKRIAETQEVLTRTEIAADFVHRMNNLAGTIPLWTQLIGKQLDENQAKDKKIATYITHINKDTKNLLKAATDLKLSVEPENIEVKELLEILGRQVTTQYLEEEVQLEIDIASDLYKVRAIHDDLANALWNIISNGIETMDSHGGKLTIAAHNLYQDGQPWVNIIITDQGPGIASENLEKIFTVFYSTKEGNDRGYGLWRSKNIIEQKLEGKIKVSSQVGVGTTFTILLPSVTEVKDE